MLRSAILPLFVFLLSVGSAASLKVLLYQTLLGRSHAAFSGTLTDALVDAGHTVDNILMEWNNNVQYNGTKKARRIIRIGVEGGSAFQRSYQEKNLMDRVDIPISDQCFIDTRVEMCEEILSRSALIEEFRSEKYDLGISALFDGCGFGLFHLIGIPATVGMVPTSEAYGLRQLLGIPSPPSFVADHQNQDIQNHVLSFPQRIQSLFHSAHMNIWGAPSINEPLQPVFRKYDRNFPKIDDLYQRMDYVFLNTHELLDITKPMSPKIKFIGGISIQKREPTGKLPEEYEKAISKAPAGFVLFSFGSFAQTSSIPTEIKHGIARAFADFPDYAIIWKYDDPTEEMEFFSQFPNIHRFKWVPQMDLLFDSRIRAFITHGGQNSFLETSAAGVPQISVPLFADQFHTAACVERNGQGIWLQKYDLNGGSVRKALRRILTEPSFTKNARQLAAMLANYPDQPRETFIRFAEMSAAFPGIGERMHLVGADLSFVVYWSLDVMAVILAAAFVVFAFVFCLFRRAANTSKKSKRE